jgi:hypothetical protein
MGNKIIFLNLIYLLILGNSENVFAQEFVYGEESLKNSSYLSNKEVIKNSTTEFNENKQLKIDFGQNQLYRISDKYGKNILGKYDDVNIKTEYTDNNYWDGLNPFCQPFNTTDYYGSGDVDLDGTITDKDAQTAMEMYNGLIPSQSRADVNGDGVIDTNDVSMINEAVNSKILPALWNNLVTKSQRNYWIDRFLANDKTNEHPYALWWQCFQYSLQTYIHATGYYCDLFRTLYDGGQTNYNLPVYYVGVNSQDFGHSINAILIGDNPLNFEDWHFFEPQNDLDAKPGDWNMPLGSDLAFYAPTWIGNGVMYGYPIITFHIEQSNYTLKSYDSKLVINKAPYSNGIPSNSPKLGRPKILNFGSGKLIFERYRDDMSRTTDIHISALNYDSILFGKPLLRQVNYSKLLAVSKSIDGNYHLLWKSKQDYNPGVFYGKFNVINGVVSDIRRLSSNSFAVECGNILEVPNGDIHAFWFDTWFEHPGIYWREKTDYTWTNPIQLTRDSTGYSDYPNEPNPMLYSFDACITSDSTINLIWKEGDGGVNDGATIVKFMQYNTNWGPISKIDSGGAVRGLIVISGIKSNIHMIYWKKGPEYPTYNHILLHKYFNGYTWSDPIKIDSSDGVSFPSAIHINDDKLRAVWIKKYNDLLVPFYSNYDGSFWSSPKQVCNSILYNALYPEIAKLEDGKLVCSWLSISQKNISIQYTYLDTTTSAVSNNFSISNNFLLEQNYPNPFNPTTNISFSLQSKGFVSLKVFDLLGREVATIVSEEMSAGSYSRTWNAATISSGVYFYRLQEGSFIKTKKLILLR